MIDPTQDPSLAIPNTPNFINPAYATPQQRAQLYQYANALMQPEPIKNGWQGLASMARALIGGYASGQADRAEQGGTYADQQRQQIINQASGANSALAPSGATAAPPSPPPAAPGPVATGSPGYPDGATAQSYAAQVAPKYGIDPKTAAAMVGAEYSDGSKYAGDGGSSFGPLQLHYAGINPKMSGPGLGDTFTAATNLDAKDPKNWQATIDYGLADAAKEGWKPWATSRDKLGFSNFTGIGSPPATPATPDQSAAAADIAARERAAGTAGNLTQAQATAIATGQSPPASGSPVDRLAAGLIPGTNGGMGVNSAPPAIAASPPLPPPRPPGLGYAPASVPPPIAAIGAALRGVSPQSPSSPPPAAAPPPAPVGAGQAPPNVTPQQLAFAMSSPNMSAAQKMQLQEWAQPKTYQDVTGNVSTSYFNQPTGAPIFHGGARGPDIGGFAQSVISGTPGAPVSTIASPALATGRGGIGGAPPPQGGNLGQAVLGPNSPAGSVIAQQQQNEAQAQLIRDKTAANTARYQQTQEAGPALLQAQYPLRQMQAILERNNGALPLGKDAPVLQGWASLGNMIATAATGHGMTDEDSRLTQMELLHKYGTVAAQNIAASVTGRPTDAQSATAASISPGTELSGPANLHLVDNLIRLNQLAQKKAAFEHDYFLDADKRGQTPTNAYDNFNQDWQKEISGPNAVPLSKYGRKVTMKSGQPGVYLPSTDPSGFSLYPANSPEFKESVMAPDAK